MQRQAGWALSLVLRASPHAALACLHAYAQTDFRRDVAAFTMPTWIIQGDAYQSTPLALTGRKTAAAIDGTHLLVYEGTPRAHRDRVAGST